MQKLNFFEPIYQWFASWKNIEAVEVQEKNEAHLLLLFLFKDVLIAIHELSSLENILVHPKVELFDPILHISPCLAGWKKQIMY